MSRRNGLYPRNDGIYGFNYKDGDRWREKSTGTRDREEALKFKQDWDRRNQDNELPKEPAKQTVEQACPNWVERHAVRLCPKARRNEQSFLRQLLKHPMAQKKLGAITLVDLQNYQAWRSKSVANRPINMELQILVRVLKENHLWRGDLRGDPGAENSGYQRLQEIEGEMKAISEVELERLEMVAASKDSWLVAYCALLICANTGLRGCELKRMRLEQIDLAARELMITRKTTKTNKGARSVSLNAIALVAMRRLVRRAELLGAKPNDFLLPADLSRHTRTSDPLKGKRGYDPTRHQESWSTAWRNLRKTAGFPDLGFHQLRHCFITRMAEEGVPLPVTQSLVGHTTDAVTRRYTHISEKAQRSAVEKLETMRKVPHFVDVLVDDPEVPTAKSLN